jgi:WXG100 family type VII secretion target
MEPRTNAGGESGDPPPGGNGATVNSGRWLVADPITWDEFRVDLRQLRDAIGSIKREHITISDTMGSIASKFAGVKDSWDTPSAPSFDAVQAWLLRVTQDLEDLLQDAIGRMQQAHDNYHRAEEANTHNLTPNGGGGGGGSSHKNQALYQNGGGQQDPTTTDHSPLTATTRHEAGTSGGETHTPLTMHLGETPSPEPPATG